MHPRSAIVVLTLSSRIATAQPDAAPTPESDPAPTPAPDPTPPAPTAQPREESPPKPAPEDKPEDVTDPTLTVYGFAMLDAIFGFGRANDPAWFDVVRPTKLAAFDNQFGDKRRTALSVRQSRFGTKAVVPTKHGDLEAKLEWELFGTGVDAGQTTLRLRHAVVDWGALRAGQTWSPFMDIDVFPNSLEYWGPNGMVFFRNVQLAWMPIRGDSRVTVAIERPGASADGGIYADRVELEDVAPRFPAPDLSAEGRLGGDWGYVELAGILRYINWDDLGLQMFDVSGHTWGWGLNLSSNLKLDPVVLRLQAVYGRGIQNYMNDAGADVAAEMTGDPASPIEGKALPVFGGVAFVDVNWSDRFTSSAGYSLVWIDNTDGQTPDAFHLGHYALANLLYKPHPNLVLGPEVQFGRRENSDDGWTVNDVRIQFSVKGTFEKKFTRPE